MNQEDTLLAPGSSWTEASVRASVVDLVHWAAGTDDYTDFHFDAESAKDRGFSGPVVNGPWKARAMRAFLEAKWSPLVVTVMSLDLEYRSADTVGSDMVFSFTVKDSSASSDGQIQATIEGVVRNASGDVSTQALIRVTVENVTSGTSLPIEATKASVSLGSPHGPFTYLIHPSDVDRYQEVSGRAPDRFDNVMPAAFFGAIDPVERRDLDLDSFLLDLPLRKVGGGNAFNEVRYERPIHAGEVLTVMTTYTDVYEKAGRESRLFFRVRENVYSDEQGQKVAVSTNGHVIAYAMDEVTS